MVELASAVPPAILISRTRPRYWNCSFAGPIAICNLVGHSFGGSVLLKYLAEGKPATGIGGLFLVAVPWWGSEGWNYDEYALPANFAAHLPQVPIFLYHSTDDPHVPITHLELYRRQLPQATVRVIDGTEHSFVHGLPELLADVREIASR